MPRLKDITCEVQYVDIDRAFTEYMTRYDDAYVETYIAVPENPIQFVIRLKSHKFIASGLAMLVYIDGNHHCNRNRTNLRQVKAGEDTSKERVEFLVRQKESKIHEDDESFVGQQWQFNPCNISEIYLLLCDD